MSFFDDDLDKAVESQHVADEEAMNAPKFAPDAGDMLHAVLLEAKAYDKGKYEPTVLMTFRNVGDEEVGGVPAGKSGVIFCPTVLRRKMLEAQPAIGTAFALRFEGKVTPDTGGNPYGDWTLFTEYMKEADASKVDPRLWNSIAARMDTDEAPPASVGWNQ